MNKKHQIIKALKRIWLLLAILFTIWLFYSYQSHGVSNALLESNSEITVKNDKNYFLFEPKQTADKIFIFYPGALVDPKAYVPLQGNLRKRYKSLFD